jgi:predicted MFS family arabinose efflux permease
VKTSTARITNEKEVTSGIDWRVVLVMTIACGLTVANNYYIQPLLGSMSREFGASESQIGIAATLLQVGQAVGFLLLVPLGDIRNRRMLIATTQFLAAFALVGVALAPNLGWLYITCFAVGVITIASQIIVPFAASLAPEHERGRVVGTVMSGLLMGILLARTVSGFVGAYAGWRAMYWVAAAVMLALALVLRATLPNDSFRKGVPYSQLLRSLWGLWRTQPVLREASAFGALSFAAFSVFWVTLTFFLETPPYQYGSDVAGLFGLIGVVGALAASLAGRLADHTNARVTTGIAIVITLLSYVVFWAFGWQLWGLVLGVVLLDLGVQAAHISNQTRVYALIPEARSRLNTVYIVTYFIGGSTGSTLGAFAWSVAGWPGVCAVGVVLLVAALAVFAFGSRNY